MKASELMSELQAVVDTYGDMEILVRHADDGWDTFGFSVNADPPSEEERREGIRGTIDITVW